jgi:hypothetical protein
MVLVEDSFNMIIALSVLSNHGNVVVFVRAHLSKDSQDLVLHSFFLVEHDLLFLGEFGHSVKNVFDRVVEILLKTLLGGHILLKTAIDPSYYRIAYSLRES